MQGDPSAIDRATVGILRARGREVFHVGFPPPWRHPANHPEPVLRAPFHCFLRPYERVFDGNGEETGVIQFAAVPAPKTAVPLALHATSMRVAARADNTHQMVPGEICVYPSLTQPLGMGGGPPFWLHHVTIREVQGQIVVYPRPARRTPDLPSVGRPATAHAKVPEGAEAAHLFSIYHRTPATLQRAGIAWRPIDVERRRALQDSGFRMELAEAHFYAPVPYPPEPFPERHLQVSYFMSREVLKEETFLRCAGHAIRGQAPEGWDGEVPGTFTSVDISAVFPDNPSRYLSFACQLVPGRLDARAMLDFRPVAVA